MLILAAVMVVAVLLTVGGDDLHPWTLTARRPDATEQISGPAWAQAPMPVPPAFFGVTVASSTGDMPGFRVGSVRLWDSHTRWAQIEPARGRFDWSILDRLVDGTDRSRLPVLFTMGGTPAWASPNAPRGPYDDDSRAAPPDDLADWDAMVRAVARRYRGRIEAYELWVMANDPHYYNGSAETLVDMARRASEIIKSADARATVVCPSMGRLWTAQGQATLRRFADLGGYRYCDAAGVKLHQRKASDPPETMLRLAAQIERMLHEIGVHPPLWNTGTAYDIPSQAPLATDVAADYAARFYLVGLYARYARMYFYSWGNGHLPITLQADGGAPTLPAVYVMRLQQWLLDARITSCGHGVPIGVPARVWRCRFTETGADLTVYWTDSGTARLPARADERTLVRLDGGSIPINAGDVLTITPQPMLVRSS